MQSEVCRNTRSIVENIYATIKTKITPAKDIYFKLNHTIYYYSGFLDIVQIRAGFTELLVNPDGTWWLCTDPASPKFKHLYLYTGGVAAEFDDFNQYFVPSYSQQSYGTLNHALISDPLPNGV